MTYLVQQNLPRTQLPTFDGSPTQWVNFITKFRDVVHQQQYLNDTQRCLHLMQQLLGPAERAVSGFSHDARGYVWSLQRLKFLFGQKTKVAQATLRLVTQGEPIPRDDIAGLVEFYYTISDCLITLGLLNYVADLYSTETLRLAVKRLPSGLVRKWVETVCIPDPLRNCSGWKTISRFLKGRGMLTLNLELGISDIQYPDFDLF